MTRLPVLEERARHEVESWEQELSLRGRVDFSISRRKVSLVLLMVLAIIAVGLQMALTDGGIAYVFLALFVLMGVWGARMLFWRTPLLVVDHSGVTVGRRRPQQFRWAEIRSAYELPISLHQRVVAVVVVDSTGGTRSISTGNLLAADRFALIIWLDSRAGAPNPGQPPAPPSPCPGTSAPAPGSWSPPR